MLATPFKELSLRGTVSRSGALFNYMHFIPVAFCQGGIQNCLSRIRDEGREIALNKLLAPAASTASASCERVAAQVAKLA